MPDIQGVIMIDVWSLPELQSFFQTVQQRMPKFDIQCCVNASYNLDIGQINDVGDRSLHNTFRLHLWNRGIEQQPLDLETMNPSDRLVFNVLRFSRSNYRTDPTLHTPDLLGSDASVVILDADDLVHHCQMYHNNSIKNWLILGQAWEMCVHHRPMGLCNLAKLISSNDYNFFVTPWSVRDQHGAELTQHCFQGSDGLCWDKVDGFGYRLLG